MKFEWMSWKWKETNDILFISIVAFWHLISKLRREEKKMLPRNFKCFFLERDTKPNTFFFFCFFHTLYFLCVILLRIICVSECVNVRTVSWYFVTNVVDFVCAYEFFFVWHPWCLYCLPCVGVVIIAVFFFLLCDRFTCDMRKIILFFFSFSLNSNPVSK